MSLPDHPCVALEPTRDLWEAGGDPEASARTRPKPVYGVCLTLPETHLPNALDLFAFVPYLALKAAGSGWRSVQQALAALVVACCCCFAAALAVCETQLPKALA